MAAFISLDPDHKTVYFVDSSGTKNTLSLASTHGINFSVDGSGDISAVTATSAASGSLEATIKLGTKEWSMSYHPNGSSEILRMVGSEAVEMGLKSDQRNIDVGASDYNLKLVGSDIEVRTV